MKKDKKGIIIALSTILLFIITMFTKEIALEVISSFVNTELSFNVKILIFLVVDILTLLIFVGLNITVLSNSWDLHQIKYFINKYFSKYLLMLFLMSTFNYIASSITGTDTSNNEEAVNTIFKLAPFYMTFSAVIYAPIVEELTFRESIRKFISNKWIGIIVSGLLFGLLHVIGGDFLFIFAYAVMGIFFSYILYDSDNIWVPISFHFLHNGFLMLLKLIVLFL